MSIDLTKLTPAPWLNDGRAGSCAIYSGEQVNCFDDVERFIAYHHQAHDEQSQADWEFIALARNAFDVMMRRGWWPRPVALAGGDTVWEVAFIAEELSLALSYPERFADPFTALVEADKWYKENVEKK